MGVIWRFQPSQPQRITSGQYDTVYSVGRCVDVGEIRRPTHSEVETESAADARQEDTSTASLPPPFLHN